jgi:membrane fusion protein, macrolide-specific efflux system
VSVARKWVFPIIWMVIFAVIAVALVKVAFFAEPADGASDFIVPTGSIEEPQIPVATGTIRNDVTLTGTVNADDAVPVKATLAGEVRKVSASVGQWVDAGAELFTIRSETPGDMLPDGTMAKPKVKTETVKAPISGTLTSLTVIVGQAVSVGEEAGNVAPASFNVTASMPPEQQYRLLSKPTEATVTITGGPAPFTCTGLSITTALAGQGEGQAATSGTTVRCAVPAEVTVFAGLAAQITIAGGLAENVLVVPTTAVEGGAQTGVVHVMAADGATEERPVTLGLNDGVSVEVIEGLAEGDMVLQFVPGAPAVEMMPEGCSTDQFGNTMCMGG